MPANRWNAAETSSTSTSPPALTVSATLGFTYVTIVATAIAFAAWFAGLKHLPAGTVGLIGLLNPVSGVLLGTLVAGDGLTGQQVAGIALVLVGLLLGQPLLSRLRRAPSVPIPR